MCAQILKDSTLGTRTWLGQGDCWDCYELRLLVSNIFFGRSVPMLVAAFIDLIGMNLFNQFVEQPSVMKMYGGQSNV